MNTYEPGLLNKLDCTIASSASLSGGVNLLGMRLVGVQMPAAWTTAGITFQGSALGNTYYDLIDTAGNELSAVGTASKWIILDPSVFAGVAFVKLRSGTSSTPVAQGAERVLGLIVREV